MSDDKERLGEDSDQPTSDPEASQAPSSDGASKSPPSSDGASDTSEETKRGDTSDSAESAKPRETAWLGPLHETLVAAAGTTGAVIVASMLAGSGSSVERLETLALLFCILVGSATWFLPRPKHNIRALRIATWAGLSCIVYWLGPMKIAEVRAEHDLENGTRTEKEQAVERLVRLGKRNLEGADLRELDFSDADLGNVNLKRSKLNRSMFKRTLLVEADLAGADLRRANFRGANLSSATLYGAKLGKKNSAARCDRFTQLPAGFFCNHGSIAQGKPKTGRKKPVSQAQRETEKKDEGQQEVTAEQQGVTAEQQGVTAEQQGVTAEQQGVTAEQQGVTAEQQGVTAEPDNTNADLGSPREATADNESDE